MAAPIIRAAPLVQSGQGYPYVSIDARVIKVGDGTGVAFGLDPQVVPFDQAARYELIDKPNTSGQQGFRFIVVTGKGVEIILDGHRIKNVVIHEVQVSYEGGPLIMEKVCFANCTFSFHPVPNGEFLTAAILNSAPTTFEANKTSGD